MEWFQAVALAVVLALAPATVAAPAVAPYPAVSAAGASAAPVVQPGNMPEYLALPADDIVKDHVQFDTVTIDVSGALAVDSGNLDGEFDSRWVDEAYDNAKNDTERRAALRAAADRLDRHVADLHEQERDALEAYNAGRLSADEYLRTLAAIDAEARALERATDRLEDYASDFSNRPVSSQRIGHIYERARSLQGPIRQRVGKSLAGQGDPLRVYVETSTLGVVLATIVGDDGQEEYLREAYLPSARDPSAENAYGENTLAVLEYLPNLYSWTMEHSDGSSLGKGVGPPQLMDVGVYPISIPHSLGQLTIYFDGGTNSTFLEYQRLDLDRIPTESPAENTSGDLRLQVNRTRVGGPLLVQVTDNETGNPIDATITVHGERIGATGEDGRLWAVTPQGQFTVNATSDGRMVSIKTSSSRPERP